jgi:hypothetical protein
LPLREFYYTILDVALVDDVLSIHVVDVAVKLLKLNVCGHGVNIDPILGFRIM